jgi:NADH dehydrogenase FAD-containing subunit
MTTMPGQTHIVILGAGFGKVGAVKRLRDADVRITLMSIGVHSVLTYTITMYDVLGGKVVLTDESY